MQDRAGVCPHRSRLPRAQATCQVQGQERRKNCWPGKRRSRSSSHSALPRDEQGAQGEPGDTRAGQWQPSPALGHHQTGPHPGSKCPAGQLKQADKGRTIPDLKNAWKYLPEGLALSPSGRGSAEELGLITPWAAFCCAEAPGGQSCRALGEGQGGWSLARTCGCTCLPDRLA